MYLNENEIKKLKDFKKELGILTSKYNLEIRGCGCCGSPYIYDLEKGKTILDNISYNEAKKEYIGDGNI